MLDRGGCPDGHWCMVALGGSHSHLGASYNGIQGNGVRIEVLGNHVGMQTMRRCRPLEGARTTVSRNHRIWRRHHAHLAMHRTSWFGRWSHKHRLAHIPCSRRVFHKRWRNGGSYAWTTRLAPNLTTLPFSFQNLLRRCWRRLYWWCRVRQHRLGEVERNILRYWCRWLWLNFLLHS